MTLKQAKKILGKIADSISDKQLIEEIKTSDFLAEIIWSFYQQKRLKTKEGIS